MAEEYGLFLSFNNYAEAFRVPVNPETLEVQEAGNGKGYTIIDLGEINAIAYPKLTEITFESIFPAQLYPFVVKGNSELLRPYEYVEMLQKWMYSRRPIRFVCSGLKAASSNATGQNLMEDIGINMPVSIENFSWKLSAGSSGDIEYSLSLKKYVFYQAVATEIVRGKAKTLQKRDSEKVVSPTYKIKAGDTLWAIARKELGDGNKYTILQKLNGISDSEVTKLQIGRVIKLS